MTYLADKKDGNGNTLVALGDSPTIDAFGRMRTSDPFTEFDGSFEYDKQTTRWLESATGSSASATHVPNRASVAMTIGTDPGSLVRRKTRTRFRYQPGKSLQVICTFVMEPKAAVNQRVGYFDSQNGVFLEMDGTSAKIVRRTYATGSAVNNAVAQSSWNIDPMDGTGRSGVTLDWTKSQILFLDFEWLGVGRVRVGFVVDGAIYYAHQFLNANNLSVVYMTTANLPVTYEIENSATASSATSLEQICCSVVSEGGFNPQGFIRNAGNGTTFKTVVSGSFTTLVSIRLKSTHIKAQLWPQSMEILGKTANAYMYWEARVRGTLGTASFSAASSAVEYDTQADALTGGDLIASGYLSPQIKTGATIFNEDIPLTADEAGAADTLTIRATAIGGTVSAVASVAWREIW